MKALFASGPRGLMIVAICLLLVFQMTSSAGAAPGGGGPVPGGPGYAVVSGISFQPYSPTNQAYAFTGGSIRNTGASSAHFIAPLALPNGATVTKMVVYYTDMENADAIDLDVRLKLMPLIGADGYLMAHFVSSYNANGLVYGETTAITYPLVDLAASSYAIEIILPASALVSLNAVRVDYAYLSSLPLAAKP